jgi:hypothetical protein
MVPQYMTFDEMKEKFPDSWVLVANPESEPAMYEIKGGLFIYKNKKKTKSSKNPEIYIPPRILRLTW